VFLKIVRTKMITSLLSGTFQGQSKTNNLNSLNLNWQEADQLVIMLDSNFSACTFVIVTLLHLRVRDIALHRDAFMFSDQFSMKFSQSPRAYAR